jgi:hypothetical protein
MENQIPTTHLKHNEEPTRSNKTTRAKRTAMRRAMHMAMNVHVVSDQPTIEDGQSRARFGACALSSKGGQALVLTENPAPILYNFDQSERANHFCPPAQVLKQNTPQKWHFKVVMAAAKRAFPQTAPI